MPVHVQVDVLKGGVEISASENTMVPERQVDELFWLRDCWAPKVVDTGALARFHDYVAASSRPVAEPWRTVGPVTVVLDEQPRLLVETRLSIHHNTVMDLAISPSGHAASIDFFGHWSVWTQAKLREQTNGEFGREARAITLSDDGAEDREH